jgi:hypothetical protein
MNIFQKIKSFFQDTPSQFVRKDLTKGVSAIPPAAVILVRNRTSKISWLIRKTEEEKGGDAWPNHAAGYFGSGKHEIIEAMSEGVVTNPLESYMTMDYQFKVYAKMNLTISELSVIKNAAYTMVQKKVKYDFLGLLSFWFSKIKPSKTRVWCDEAVIEWFYAAQIKLSNKLPEKSTPDDVEEYLESNEAMENGWVLFDGYNV